MPDVGVSSSLRHPTLRRPCYGTDVVLRVVDLGAAGHGRRAVLVAVGARRRVALLPGARSLAAAPGRCRARNLGPRDRHGLDPALHRGLLHPVERRGHALALGLSLRAVRHHHGDDGGLWYRNDYGPDWETAYNSFTTYRKEFPVGQDGWLTASLSARDRGKDGVIETPPSIRTELQGDRSVAVLDVPDHTGGAIFRPTEALPPRYRIEYKLTTLDFGGRRHGALEYEGRINGYDAGGCKTQHPWGEGSNSPGWTGDASAPYCEWQDVRAGPYGYNGFHFLAIVDVADPAPRNNHFWHYRRKVLMDAFSQHPDRVGSGAGGQVCDFSTNGYYDYRDSSFNTVNMWISGLPNWTPAPGGLPGNSRPGTDTVCHGFYERHGEECSAIQICKWLETAREQEGRQP